MPAIAITLNAVSGPNTAPTPVAVASTVPTPSPFPGGTGQAIHAELARLLNGPWAGRNGRAFAWDDTNKQWQIWEA
jgi:hypothetical protein